MTQYMPLIGLLGHHQQRLMQVLHLGTDAQQTLGFLDVAATIIVTARAPWRILPVTFQQNGKDRAVV